MSSQCPVNTQMHTIDTANEKLKSSAAVNRPQNPNDIRLPSEHDFNIYWHIGSSKNANATVAIIAVHTANSICIESKKKNITNNDTDAPNGRQSACIVSNVANLSNWMEGKRKLSINFWFWFWFFFFKWKSEIVIQIYARTWFRLNRFARQQIVHAIILTLFFTFTLLLLHIQATKTAINNQ